MPLTLLDILLNLLDDLAMGKRYQKFILDMYRRNNMHLILRDSNPKTACLRNAFYALFLGRFQIVKIELDAYKNFKSSF